MAESTEPPPPGPMAKGNTITDRPLPAAPSHTATSPAPKARASVPPNRQTRHQPKYVFPLPVHTFPLPTFYPSNPLSLVHLAVVWLGQVLSPPAPEPSVVYTGLWSSATRSVHVTDPRAMRDLWCQGFFGKGSLSRSEPNWLNREKARGGLLDETSEQRTTKRREERADSKWERGRSEFEAIEQRRQREAEAERAAAAAEKSTAARISTDKCANDKQVFLDRDDAQEPDIPTGQAAFKAPVGPLELLALPNSEADLLRALEAHKTINGCHATRLDRHADDPACQLCVAPSPVTNSGPVSLREISSNSKADVEHSNGSACDAMDLPLCNNKEGDIIMMASGSDGDEPSDGPGTTSPSIKQQKSVRFSPTIESTTFQHSDPPSRNDTGAAPSQGGGAIEEGNPAGRDSRHSTGELAFQNKEHLQLSAEEAFFLTYALGVLVVRDPEAGNTPLSTEQLFLLFRQFSYFPPRTVSDQLAPDDPFLVHYAVYHHFRSLGWVPRHGIKFGVDWLLYGKGPALDHAPFGVMVVPSYTDPWWGQQQKQQRQPPRKSWHWLHSVNRVLTTVYKSMVLVYVDIPAPLEAGAESASALLQRYKIRETMVRRWSSNRNRD